MDLANFTFRDLRLRFARKAAISIVSMDGANISAVRFENVTIEGRDVATPLFIKVGNRAACEDGKVGRRRGTPGSIGPVTLSAVTALGWGNATHTKAGHGRGYTATVEGLNSSYPVGPVYSLHRRPQIGRAGWRQR